MNYLKLLKKVMIVLSINFWYIIRLPQGAGWEAAPSNARLYFRDDHTNKRIGAWCPATHDIAKSDNGYLQVDLGSQKTINYIATQGIETFI